MIAKHTLGKGFYGLLAYVLREDMAGREAEAHLLGGNMSGQHALELANEFAVFHALNRAVSRPVFHASLRLPAGESLTDAQWRQAATEYLTQMGYTDTAYVVARHPEHHIHIVASRVRFDGTAVDAWQDRWRGLAAVAAIERRFGLTQPKRPVRSIRDRRAPCTRATDSTQSRRRPASLERADGKPGPVLLPFGGSASSAGTLAPPNMVGAARDSLAQQRRWNGHLDEDAVARLAAAQLFGRFPKASVRMVMAAVDAARPGTLPSRDGGEVDLAVRLSGLVGARLATSACIHEEGEYPTR